MKKCNIELNRLKCNCTYEPCSRKGICCECLRYHLESEELPACFFTPKIEKTYDRSIKKFIDLYNNK
ncbi:MAG: DUF6485 family protein [Bacteroidales bacterium]|jgi:hypothetical protein|nr:hypothetical protein [Bacteroidales bacterium]MDI9576468.1 DUF6485 family protein [Bacteroidota bacterium]MDD2594026.1 DUF6485 family protein [Bacteroidales bacterium]MDD3755827.1 DUF6485 family protein [Bacteroidales bacterium]MDY0401115.1 DUF6485 family protein [Bacteroidales bacterium]